jgi:hypothetical protein
MIQGSAPFLKFINNQENKTLTMFTREKYSGGTFIAFNISSNQHRDESTKGAGNDKDTCSLDFSIVHFPTVRPG